MKVWGGMGCRWVRGQCVGRLYGDGRWGCGRGGRWHGGGVTGRVGAFVGGRGANAGEYYDEDFAWETLCEEGRVAVARQRRERLEQGLGHGLEGGGVEGRDVRERGRGGEGGEDVDVHAWEDFHAKHSLGRFFKEKRYLPMEFPCLLTAGAVIGEVGCGCGSALIPVLRANPSAVAVACDVSETAISVCMETALPGAGIEAGRVSLSVHDFPATSPFVPGSLDILMVIFTLSAFHPNDMCRVVDAAWAALKPGGVVVFRDYGQYDMAQLRFHGRQLVDDESLVYGRLDGTLSHFFAVDDVRDLFSCRGFRARECKYCTVKLRNKKTGLGMKRVFVHGVFEKVAVQGVP
jgi:methyltransferase-like protein 6